MYEISWWLCFFSGHTLSGSQIWKRGTQNRFPSVETLSFNLFCSVWIILKSICCRTCQCLYSIGDSLLTLLIYSVLVWIVSKSAHCRTYQYLYSIGGRTLEKKKINLWDKSKVVFCLKGIWKILGEIEVQYFSFAESQPSSLRHASCFMHIVNIYLNTPQ